MISREGSGSAAAPPGTVAVNANVSWSVTGVVPARCVQVRLVPVFVTDMLNAPELPVPPPHIIARRTEPPGGVKAAPVTVLTPDPVALARAGEELSTAGVLPPEALTS